MAFKTYIGIHYKKVVQSQQKRAKLYQISEVNVKTESLSEILYTNKFSNA